MTHTSWSEIDTARQCLQKHQLRYKAEWETKDESRPLTLGNMWHELMEDLYGGDAGTPVKKLRKWRDEEVDPDFVDVLAWMLKGYYDAWGSGDPTWRANVWAVEMEFELPLPDVGFGPLTLKGFIDLIVNINGKLWVVDHKSSGSPRPRDRDLDMADQWTLYVWALRELGHDVFGSIHNYAMTKQLVRKQTVEERFARIPIHRTQREVEAVAREASITAWLAKGENGAPRSPGDHCWRRCDFIDVCVADRRYGTRLSDSILTLKHQPRERYR